LATATPSAKVEVWATDEHRIGLKPVLKRVWSLPGQRPIALVEPRYDWRYLVAFAHPASGRTFWHLADGVSTDIFAAELRAFAEAAGAGPQKQIILVLDGAGWHTSAKVSVPDHVHLLFLPAHTPELQPCEHLWQFADAPLVNRHFHDMAELEDVQMERCAILQQQTARLRSATLFPWWPRRIRKRQGPRRT
jgi:hypothetical protein